MQKDFILIIFFIEEILKYTLAGKIFFDLKIYRKWLYIIGVFGAGAVTIFFPVTAGKKYIVIYFFVIMIAYGILYEKNKQVIEKIIFLFLSLSCLDGIIDKIIKMNFNRNTYESMLHPQIIYGTISFIILLLTHVIKKGYMKRKKRKVQSYFEKYGWITILCMFPSMFLTSAGITIIVRESENLVLKDFIERVSLLSYISILLLIIFLIYVRSLNLKLESMIQINEQMKVVQEQYYKTLLEREFETKKSRHDWKNHLICLAELSKKEQAEAAYEYINQLVDQLNQIGGKQYDVGNDIINAILNYYFRDVDEEIVIIVRGICIHDFGINDRDLCIIVSNLISNAIEYLQKKEELKKKEIEVVIRSGELYQEITVKNTICKKMRYEQLKQTSKSDKKNHGYGISNVKECVERNKGQFYIDITDNIFMAKVIINNKRN